MAYQDTLLLINGKWRASGSGRTIPVLNPATEETIGKVAHADRSDLDEALAAAAAGFKVWRAMSALDRSRIMRKAAELMRERADAIATLMTMEQGKVLAEAKVETLAAADVIEWFAEEARRAYGRVIPARGPGVYQLAVKEPVGPVAAFTPWNFPINQVCRKLSAALAAGCSIIVKAPEETPASPAELLRTFVDAGVPKGVINLVFGVPAEISEYLIPHPVIRKISFTGSTVVGKQLSALAGLHMKRATMELGGHAPAIVFNDADVSSAAKILLGAKYRNAGQVCIAPTRLLVQDQVYKEFVSKFAEGAKAIKTGNGLDADSKMGSLANTRRVPAIEGFVQDALAKGGKLEIDIPAYDYPKTAKNTVKLGKKLKAGDFDIAAPKGANEVRVRVIGVIENQAPTRALEADLPVEDGLVAMDRRNDVCQIALVERHRGTGGVTNAFVSGFGYMGDCAMASSVAHDSHHIIVVGTNKQDMALAVNRLGEVGGGVVLFSKGKELALVEMPIAGLMSDERAEIVAAKAEKLTEAMRKMGCSLNNAYMQHSLLALVVIPELRISDVGLIDVTTFQKVDLFI